MNVYKYWPNVNKYDALKAKKKGVKVVNAITGNPMGSSWSPLSVTVETETGVMSDFPRLEAHVPVFSQRAWESLKSLISLYVEALPLDCKAGNFFAINVLRVENCLDLEKSEFGKLGNGVIYSVRKYVFHPETPIPAPIFRLEQVRNDILVTDVFRDLVEKEELRGLIWHPAGTFS